MKIAIATPRARNSLVAIARLRHAGRHRPQGNAARQMAKTQLRRELQQMAPPQHIP